MEQANNRVLPVPQPVDVHSGDVQENWKLVKFQFENYSIATRLDNKEETIKVASLLSNIGREAHEATNYQLQQMETPHTTEEVVNWTTGKHKKTKEKEDRVQPQGQGIRITQCFYCGESHLHKKEFCPAYGKSNKRTENRKYGKICRLYERPIERAVRETLGERRTDQEEQLFQLSTNTKNIWITDLEMGTRGATCDVMSSKDYPSIFRRGHVRLENSKIQLECYNGQCVQPIGQKRLWCQVPNTQEEKVLTFQFVDTEQKPLISAEICDALGLVKVCVQLYHIQSRGSQTKDTIMSRYPDLFKGIGCLSGKHHLEMDTGAKPVQQPPCRHPIVLQPKVKEKLTEMIKDKIVEQISEPTEWIGSLVLVTRDGKLRMCLDPHEVNKVLRRARLIIPTIEELLPEQIDAKVFSIMDIKNGFWHMQLDEASNRLTTYWGPDGERYNCLQYHFGLSTAPEDLQRALMETLQELNGVAVIADGILVYDKGHSEKAARAENRA
ncbi:hypothetical protein PR048_017529 [Dryococelus australis]|uniref:Reverse transcriptase domain-containing protein n=1 Tax=Dryococelus australis TaxID=614101 RepID=A0ABQ9H9S2_9NEOP|nr:hypothetical protein PR048_017529 [Dryococelus australis]